MLHVDDAGFVRAPAPLVYRRLTDIGAWPSWWPGVTVRPVPDPGGHEAWAVQLRRDRLRGLRLALRPHGYRHQQGFRMTVDGDLSGHAEFWLEDAGDGTVVHHLLTATPGRRPLATLATYRVVVRRGLWGCKDALQSEVRTAIGLLP